MSTYSVSGPGLGAETTGELDKSLEELSASWRRHEPHLTKTLHTMAQAVGKMEREPGADYREPRALC